MLRRLSRGWLPPHTPSLGVVSLRSGEAELDFLASRMRPEGDRLLVEYEISGAVPSASGAPRDELNPPSIFGKCEDGTTFSLRDAVATRVTEEDLKSLVERVVITSQDWSIRRSSTRAQLWAGIVDTELHLGPGNMSLTTTRSESRGHYRLSGSHYVYYLIRTGPDRNGRWIFAVDPQGAPQLDRGLLRDEITNLAFSFGCPFNVSKLHGLDERGAPVAFEGSDFGLHHPPRPRVAAPVPERGDPTGWSVSFFKALSAGFASPDASVRDGLRRAIRHYLDALSDSSASGFELKMLLGSLVAARLVLGERAALVATREPWDGWIAGNRGQIEELAVRGLADELMTAIRRCEQPGEASLIRMALSRVGLEITDGMEAAIDAAVGQLSGGRAEERSARQRGVYLRTLLVALLAKKIGYGGPICGWEDRAPHLSDLPADPSWWKVDGSVTAELFSAEASRTAAPPAASELWPRFRLPLPPVPEGGLIAVIVMFAAALEAKSDGLVAANVEPVPRTSGDKAVFDFYLQSTIRPAARTRLFSIEEAEDGALQITNWTKPKILLRKESDLTSFLEDVAQDNKTRDRVERLMFIGWPVQ